MKLYIPSLHNINSYKYKGQNCPVVNERMVQKLKSSIITEPGYSGHHCFKVINSNQYNIVSPC